jgi:hypothetical protein
MSQTVRSKNGLGTAALVLGVASLVAALSFVLLPLGLLGRLVCGILALAVGIAFSCGLALSWSITRAFYQLQQMHCQGG